MDSERKISVFPLAWGELGRIPLEQKTMYVCLCFLVSELNVLQRLTLLSLKEFPDDPLLERAARVQSNTLIRTYSSKCFETQVFVVSCVKKCKDAEVREFAADFEQRFALKNAGKGYAIAEYLRHKIGFHLDFREAMKSTRTVLGKVDCDLYIQESDGNCFFPAGEDIIQGSCFWGASDDAKHAIKSEEDHAAWVDWSISVHALAKEMHQDAFERFVLSNLTETLSDPVEHRLDEELFATFGDQSLPLFAVAKE